MKVTFTLGGYLPSPNEVVVPLSKYQKVSDLVESVELQEFDDMSKHQEQLQDLAIVLDMLLATNNGVVEFNIPDNVDDTDEPITIHIWPSFHS